MTKQDEINAIKRGIESFSFSDYGMDDVDEIKGEEWADDLAWNIWEAIQP